MGNQEVKNLESQNFEQKKLQQTLKSNFETEIFSLTQDLKSIRDDIEAKKFTHENEENIIVFKNQLNGLIQNLDKIDLKSESNTNEILDIKKEILDLQLQVLAELRNDELVKSNPKLAENIQNSIEAFASIIAKKNKEKIIFETKKSIPDMIKFYGPAGKIVQKIFEKSGLYNS